MSSPDSRVGFGLHVFGEGKAEADAFGAAGEQLEVAAVVEQDLFGDGEPEAHAFADLAAGGVGFEEVGAKVGRNAGAVVGHIDPKGVAVATDLEADGADIALNGKGAVVAQVDKDLADHFFIEAGLYAGWGFGDVQLQIGPGLGEGGCELIQHLAEVHQLALGFADFGKGGEALGEFLEAVEFFVDAGFVGSGLLAEVGRLFADKTKQGAELHAGGGERGADLVGVTSGGFLPGGEGFQVGKALALFGENAGCLFDHAGKMAEHVATVVFNLEVGLAFGEGDEVFLEVLKSAGLAAVLDVVEGGAGDEDADEEGGEHDLEGGDHVLAAVFEDGVVVAKLLDLVEAVAVEGGAGRIELGKLALVFHGRGEDFLDLGLEGKVEKEVGIGLLENVKDHHGPDQHGAERQPEALHGFHFRW